jgi:hypothetical protein
MKVEKFQLGDLQSQVPSLLTEAFDVIRSHSTSFIVNSALIGSATFVRIGKHAGFLTAKHVWERLCELTDKDPMIGIQLYLRRHGFFIDRTKLVPLFETKRKTKAFGPDLVFLKIADVDLGPIEASEKVFLNLSKTAMNRYRQAASRFGFLIISGFPEAMTKPRVSVAPNARLLGLFNLGMMVAKTRSRRKWTYDYWEMQTEVGTQPRDYGGVSGGGVWRVVLQKKLGEPVLAARIQSISLCGVAFYQSDVKAGWRFIRAHGPDSVYVRLRRVVESLSYSRPGAENGVG